MDHAHPDDLATDGPSSDGGAPSGTSEPLFAGRTYPQPAGPTASPSTVDRRTRRRVRLASATTAALVAATTTLVAVPLVPVALDSWSDALRSAPQPLLSTPVDVGDTGAEQLYKAAAPSVVTLTAGASSSGTGFVYRPGLVLTNWHVVAGDPTRVATLARGEQVEVAVLDHQGRARTGTVVAADDRLDLALVEVDGLDDLPPLPLGDPDVLDVGQPVFIIGAPFGIPGTMTRGVVTGTSVNTTFAQTTVQTGLLMTDAAANPGNSGGPLLAADGSVVGVVTLRPDESGGRSVQGLTFALPADAVAWAAAWLERGEDPRYGIIGVAGGTASADVGVAGVLVAAVSDGMPAAAAGVEVGDVIVEAAGEPIDDFDDLVDALRLVEVGEQFEMTVARPTGPFEVPTYDEATGQLPAAQDVDRRRVRLQVELVERPEGV